jgi:hypothetical protein
MPVFGEIKKSINSVEYVRLHKEIHCEWSGGIKKS